MNLTPDVFVPLREYIVRLCGLSLPDDKIYLVQQRLEPLVRESGCDSFEAFVRRLPQLDSPHFRDRIIEAVTTHETAFFRDGHPFETFRRVLLPEMIARLQQRRAALALRNAIRIWCAAVSTGQEAYSIAITILDYLDAVRPAGVRAEDFQILATDISPLSLATAQAGEYSEREVQRGLSASDLMRHFVRTPHGYRVAPRLRRLIDFRRSNLVQDTFERTLFDAIFCRNVLIYFDEPIRRIVIDRFAQRLVDGGFLCLGAAENLYGLTSRFVSERHRETIFYRKRD